VSQANFFLKRIYRAKILRIIENGKHHLLKSAFKSLIVNKMGTENQGDYGQNIAMLPAKV